MTEKVQIREDFKALIPPLSQDEREGLEQSILDHGCRDALLTWKGWVVDGHNRFEICEGNGIEYRTQEMEFEDDGDVKIWMIRNQFGRRNLDAYTRAKLAIELKGLFAAKAKENQSLSNGRGIKGLHKSVNLIERVDTQKELARIAGTSHDTIAKVERIERDASPELRASILKQEVSINGAYNTIRAAEKAAKKVEKVERKKSDSVGSFELILSALQTAQNIEPESIDFIITDPPYPKEFLETYSHLADFAKKYLKDGGSLIVMVGQSYLPELMSRLNVDGLKYQWCLSYLTPGGQSTQLWDRKVNTFWKPLLWFVKGNYSGDWIGDVSKSNVNDNNKQHHHWGQSESGMNDIVQRFTYPGDLICDPFCGGGTTGVVSIASGRNFIGIDCDKKSIDTAMERLLEIQ